MGSGRAQEDPMPHDSSTLNRGGYGRCGTQRLLVRDFALSLAFLPRRSHPPIFGIAVFSTHTAWAADSTDAKLSLVQCSLVSFSI